MAHHLRDADRDDDIPDSTAVEEAEEIANLVNRVVRSQGDEATQILQRWRAILNRYQEESQLLDAFLEGIVTPLAQLLRLGLQAAKDLQARQRILGVCRLLNIIVSVRGYKTVVRFFPHDASDLEAVLNLLLVIKGLPAPAQGSDEEAGLACWEAQAILMLWLSMLILTPFSLKTLDTTQTTEAEGTDSRPYTLLVGRVLEVCQEYLHHPGGVRDMAALLLGRLLARPDMGPALQEHLAWSQEQLTSATSTQRPDTPFLVAGVLQTLLMVFKLGQRSALLPHAPAAWAQLGALHAHQSACAGGTGSAAGVLARKLTIKLAQRVALTFLTPRLAPWRYQKADAGADLELRLGAEGVAHEAAGSGKGGPDDAASGVDAEGDGDGEEFELAEEIEEAIEMLLTALRDKDTVVRWSAAKGLGRITGCLPRDLGDEVVESVTTLFRWTESDTAWHGACLALAELARRGLLLPTRLSAVAPSIQQALLYDVRRGPHSVGAHVRDAAAYVCWAFARAYAPEAMAPSVHALSSTLLTTACYDREVNCRRAAAAAFQECVGRLGNFPHGIDLMGVADYFAVGNLSNAYLHVAVSVARFPAYRLPLAQHLVNVQLRHWDKALRELAAQALAALVPAAGAEYLGSQALDVLLPLCTDQVLEARHGAVVGVSELLPALQAAGLDLSDTHREQVSGLVPAIDRARLYRGKGGEVMREAVSRLVGAMSSVALPLTAQQHAKVMEALDENLRSPQAHIQRAAVLALGQYSRVYVSSPDRRALFARYYDGFIARLHDGNVAVRRGYALALGALPFALLSDRAEEVILALIGGTAIEEDSGSRDTEARANCVTALMRVCDTLYGGAGAEDRAQAGRARACEGQGPVQEGVQVMTGKVLPCIYACLRDYTVDNRGDVGSWVRERAMLALTHALPVLAHQLHRYPLHADTQGQPTALLQEVVPEAVAALLKQAVERIARMREAAMQHLRTLATPLDANDKLSIAAYVPAQSTLLNTLPTDQEALQSITSLDALSRLPTLMHATPVYRRALLEGLVSSIGGVDAQLAKAASAALLQQLSLSHGSPSAAQPAPTDFLSDVAHDLLSIWQRHAKSARMAGSLLRTADLIVTRAPEVCTLPLQQALTSDQGAMWCEAVVQLARAETRMCTDVPRLLDAATLLCHLLPCPNPCRTWAYQGLLVLLANKYPKVRRHTAEQLYLALLPMEPSEVGGSEGGILGQAAEAATELLLVTSWDKDLDTAKAARNALAGHLSLSVPVMQAGPAGGSKTSAAMDEYSSYQSLVDDFARGV